MRRESGDLYLRETGGDSVASLACVSSTFL